MKNKKSFLIILISIMILSVFSILNVVRPFDNLKNRRIYDNNQQIIEAADTFSFNNRVGSNSNDSTALVFEFSGMESLWNIVALEETIVGIEFNSEVKRGRFKVVLISPDGELLNVLENTASGNEVISIKEGKSTLKIVGDRTKGKLELVFNEYEGLTLIPIN